MMTRARLTVAAGAAALMVAVLSLQFLLGMGVNLTVHVAHARFGFGSMMSVMRGKPLLMVHMMLGMLTAALALVAAVAAGVSGRTVVAASGVVGFLAVLVAGYGGIRFLLSGGAAASFTMAAGFLVAYAAYFIELVALVRLHPRDPRGGDGSPTPGSHLGGRGQPEPGVAGIRRSS